MSGSIPGDGAFGATVSALIMQQLQLAGSDPIIASDTIAPGQTLQHGDILGRRVDTLMVRCDASAIDGSAVPVSILLEDLDTTQETGPKTFPVLVSGHVNETALGYYGGHTPDTVRAELASRGIYLNAPRYSFA